MNSKKDRPEEAALPEEEAGKATQEPEPEQEPAQENPPEPAEDKAAAEHERYLRLAAEYDNYRKRSARERESIYSDVRADTVTKFLPVYDNLARCTQPPASARSFRL